MDESRQVGRVLRSSTSSFTVGCRSLVAEQGELVPRLGALLRAAGSNSDAVYGLICNVTIEDDAFVRQLVAAGVESEEIIEDQRQQRQVPIVIDVLTVGFREGDRLYQRLPPQPPRTLDQIVTCENAEFRRFTETHDWLRVLLSSQEVGAVDQIIVATLLAAAEARPSNVEREAYLVGAGRELAQLLALELTRLEGILRQLRPS